MIFKLEREWVTSQRGVDTVEVEADTLEEAIEIADLKSQCKTKPFTRIVLRDDPDEGEWEKA